MSTTRPAQSRLVYRVVAAALVAPLLAFAACAGSDAVPPNEGSGSAATTGTGGSGDPGGTGGTGNGSGGAGGGDPAICLLHNCDSDAECAGCSDGRTTCLVAEHRCVACDADSGTGCPEGQVCSSWGNCVPEGLECPTDVHGTPQISCTKSADCAACDPMHQVCDPATKTCVACTPNDTSACQSTDLCIDNKCSPRCPPSCNVDNDCAKCGSEGNEAHACNAHKCAECSPTYACPAGKICSPQGVCIAKCGFDAKGTCSTDDDCANCGADAKDCHTPINGGDGKCGPSANGCSDLGKGVVVLPEPWSQVTNACSNDADCDGIGIEFNVGKMLRDLTGLDEIDDANIEYGMNVCADITVGIGESSLSCGICVPCKVDSDCEPIDVDQVAAEAFGPIGSVAAALLLDQVFGPNDHKVQMYCQTVAGDYGVCAPCPGIVYACGIGSGGGGGSGKCDHDACESGGPLDPSCDDCTEQVCAIDSYCCETAWDSLCVSEVEQYCAVTCDGPPPGCEHDECVEGNPLAPDCSSCAEAVCAADPYCCETEWDATCILEVEQECGFSCR